MRDELGSVEAATAHALERGSPEAIATEVRDEVKLGTIEDSMWRESRKVLAETLTDSEWSDVAIAYTAVSLLTKAADQPDEVIAHWTRIANRSMRTTVAALLDIPADRYSELLDKAYETGELPPDL